MGTGTLHRGDHIVGTGAAHDRRGSPVNHRVEDPSGQLIVLSTGPQDTTTDGALQPAEPDVVKHSAAPYPVEAQRSADEQQPAGHGTLLIVDGSARPRSANAFARGARIGVRITSVPSVLEHLVEGPGELGVTVTDEESRRATTPRHRQISGLLGNPGAVGWAGDRGQPHLAATDFDEEQDNKSARSFRPMPM
jgi:hypothetical protein